MTYDAELRRHDEVLRRACGVRAGEQVLDIGCGVGQTTCAAARLARPGGALGVRGFACTREALGRMDPVAAEGAVERLREMLAGHLSGDGVWFGSRCWIVTARRQ